MKKLKNMHTLFYFCFVLLIVVCIGFVPFSHAQDSVVTLDRSNDRGPVGCATTSDPVSQTYILTEVPNAVATLLIFPGGGGKLGAADGEISINANGFLVRSRKLFASFGFNLAVMDAATDFLSCPYGLRGQRLSPEHLSDIEAVIKDLHAKYPGKEVWAVGMCRSTLSAAQAAAELPVSLGAPNGMVVFSTVTQLAPPPSNYTIFDIALEAIQVPTLIVTNKKDECWVSPPNAVKSIKDQLISAPTVHIQRCNGGFEPLSLPCRALSYHGYFGIEPEVISKVAKWIDKQVH